VVRFRLGIRRAEENTGVANRSWRTDRISHSWEFLQGEQFRLAFKKPLSLGTRRHLIPSDAPAAYLLFLNNPGTGQPMKRPRLYQRMLALGKRAGVPNSHAHRFRDTLAVDMLQKGASPYDVAKMLGDTIDTVEKQYAPFTKELRDRARRIMENGEGLEKISGTFWTHSSHTKEKTN
jgi:integrase